VGDELKAKLVCLTGSFTLLEGNQGAFLVAMVIYLPTFFNIVPIIDSPNELRGDILK
jgi:hypothetical protein